MFELVDAARRSAAIVLLCLAAPCFAQDGNTVGRPATLDDLYSAVSVVDAAVSTSGRFLAVIVRRETDDTLLLLDLATGERKGVQRLGFADAGNGLSMHMSAVYWKSDERMLLRRQVRIVDEPNPVSRITKFERVGDRLFAVDRNGGAVPLLAEKKNRALEGASNLGAIMSLLPKDPQHILMLVDGYEGPGLLKVDLETGRGERIEHPSEDVVAWWLDLDGNPVVRVTVSFGTVRFSSKDAEGKWRVFYKTRLREMRERDDYEPVGPSKEPNKYYVLARPSGHDRFGLYMYDLSRNEFGEPLNENPTYDLLSAQVARDGSGVMRYCYMADVRVCEFTDATIDAHMRGLRKFFEDSANVYVVDASEDDKTILLYVEGPRDPPAYYYYQTEKRNIQFIGTVQKGLEGLSRPRASVVSWQARDGKRLGGYLTVPEHAPAAQAKLPLVVYPHGGPEMRDHLTFDPWVQYLTARGYAVFQPNFRGSDGFGREFAESGYGEWGRKMQDDITDGVKMLVDQETVDPTRMCIVGASYGGYAALAAASLTPDLFKCAVSIAGISDLGDFIDWRKRNWGSDSEGYTYWLKAIGDPDKDEKRLREVSPIRLVAEIKTPVLLIHGTTDQVVPISQSRAMKKALDGIGTKADLIELEGEGHSGWADTSERRALSAIDEFLWRNIGPGYDVKTPPAKPLDVPRK